MKHSWRISSMKSICIALLFAGFFVVSSGNGYAAVPPVAPPNAPHGTCTSDPQFETTKLSGKGLITNIVEEVKKILVTLQESLYNSVKGGASPAIKAAITLYIAIYGLMFTVGMMNITVYDFTVRMVKLGIVIILVSGDSWDFFGSTVVKFFNEGTDQWISEIAKLGVGDANVADPDKPFATIDAALISAVSAKTAVNLMAAFFTPPYGVIIGILLSLGMTTFVKAVLQAAWVYLMSLIVKTLLFGMAPIFIACLLFEHTKYLFTGWLNQVINVSLQPILLFTFLAFFVTMIDASISNMMKTPVCWTEAGDSLRGTPFSLNYWRFALCDGADCQPYGGKWGFNGPQAGSGPTFPIPILGVLVLVLLADLCAKFNTMVPQIAGELAGASLNLATMGGALSDWFNNKKPDAGGGGGGGGKAPLPNQGTKVAAEARKNTEGMIQRTVPGASKAPPAGTPPVK